MTSDLRFVVFQTIFFCSVVLFQLSLTAGYTYSVTICAPNLPEPFTMGAFLIVAMLYRTIPGNESMFSELIDVNISRSLLCFGGYLLFELVSFGIVPINKLK